MRKKNKFVAALIAIFLGWAGIHKFYLGDPKSGIFYIMIMIFTSALKFPITQFLGFFDAFKLLTMGQSEFDRKYNKHVLMQRQRRGKQYKPKGSPVSRPKEKSSRSFKPKVNPYKKTGLKKYEEFDTEEAVKDLRKAIEIEPNNKDLYFKLACAYSQLEEVENGIKALDKAIKYGYKNVEKINTIEDLAFLRIHPTYQVFKQNNYSLKKTPQISAPKENLLDNDVILSQLNKLVELKEKGLLSETEFVKEKRKLLQR